MYRRVMLGTACLLSVLAIYLGQGSRAHADPVQQPVILGYKGDLWTWDTHTGSQPVQRTTWGYNQPPVLSPDGTQMAYASVAQVMVDAIKQKRLPGGSGSSPTNIWLLDVLNPGPKDATRIADQPSDAAFADPAKANHYIMRSSPTWSMDGGSLAWTQLEFQATKPGDYQLVVYSRQTKTSIVIVSKLPFAAAMEGFVTESVKWGTPGLAVQVFTIDKEQAGSRFYFFDPTGKALATSAIIPNTSADFMWITNNAKDYLAVLSLGNNSAVQWLLIDPQTGQTLLMDGLPELYSPVNPTDGLVVAPAKPFSVDAWTVSSIHVSPNDITAIGDAYHVLGHMALSPDGMSLAYTNDQHNLGTTNGASGGGITLAEQVTGLGWGPGAWRVRHTSH